LGIVGDDLHMIDCGDSDILAQIDVAVCHLSRQSTWMFVDVTVIDASFDVLTDHDLLVSIVYGYPCLLLMMSWTFWMVATNPNSQFLHQYQLPSLIYSKVPFVVLPAVVSIHLTGYAGVEGTLVCIVACMDVLRLIGTCGSSPHAS